MSSSSQPEILAVVLNCHRPANIPLVIEALRAQTVKCHVALVDCGGLPDETLILADSVFWIGSTCDPGPLARLLPLLAFPQFFSAFFAVDDYLPGPRCVEFMLASLAKARPRSAVGQDGRRIIDGKIIRRKARLHETGLTTCDFITSSELVYAPQFVASAHAFARMMAEHASDASLFEDDLVAGMGLAATAGMPCHLTPAPPTSEHSWRMKRLPSHNALSARPDHDERRNHFVREAIRLGWKSRCH